MTKMAIFLFGFGVDHWHWLAGDHLAGVTAEPGGPLAGASMQPIN